MSARAWAAWAAVLLSLPLTVGGLGLLVLLWPGPLEAHALAWLLLAFPTWVGVMAAGFLFRSGAWAWGVMGTTTLVLFGLIFLVKQRHWVGLPA